MIHTVLTAFERQHRPISVAELGQILGVSEIRACRAIAFLNEKKLIVRDNQNNWRLNVQPMVLSLLHESVQSDIAIAHYLKLPVELIRYELKLLVDAEQVRVISREENSFAASQLIYQLQDR